MKDESLPGFLVFRLCTQRERDGCGEREGGVRGWGGGGRVVKGGEGGKSQRRRQKCVLAVGLSGIY